MVPVRDSKCSGLLALCALQQKMQFIEINNRILDFDEYRKEVKVMKYMMEYDLKEYFAKFGFIVKEKTKFGNKLFLVFYNENLDIEARVTLAKTSEIRFV